MLIVLTCVMILVAMVAVPVWVLLATYNRLVALDQRCDTAFADIDAHLKHRQNLIPPLVETVRGFADHEKEILLGITTARASALQATGPEARLKAERNLTRQVSALIATAERYPDLRASSHFHALRDELIDAENRITASRRFFNLAVGEYDATLRQFPGSYVARVRKMNVRMPFDLGIERVLVDEPIRLNF